MAALVRPSFASPSNHHDKSGERPPVVLRRFGDEAQEVVWSASMLNGSLIYTLGIGILLGIFILGFFVWGVNNGAFDHSEDAKYVLFRDDDDDD